MATIHNPTARSLWCDPIKRALASKETAEVTDAQAAATSAAIFVVATGDAEPTAEVEPEAESSDGTAAPVSRRQAARGSSVAEVSGGPVGEVR